MSWKSSLAAIAAVGLALPALADWDPSDGWKWLQEPDMTPWSGIDIAVGNVSVIPQYPPFPLPGTVADDFKCGRSGPITDIHLWMSYQKDEMIINPMKLTFALGIWSDIPAGLNQSFSRPGELLKGYLMTPTSYRPYGPPISLPDPNNPEPLKAEYWWNPLNPDVYDVDSQVYQFNFNPIKDPYWQQEGTIYWLSVSVLGEWVEDETGLGRYVYDDHIGWKTSINVEGSIIDDAVYLVPEPDNPLQPWAPLVYPNWHRFYTDSIDMAFVITPEPSQYAVVVGLGLVAFAGCRRFRAR